MPVSKTPLAPLTLACLLFLSACGGSGENSAASGAEFNDADVEFARGMIPHHEQAVDMSRLAEERAGEEVQELAGEIEAAQGPEIERLTGMLDAWGEEPVGGKDHADGMMTEEQLAELERAEGAVFDTMFLEMMIAHHEGAVEMSENQLVAGVNPEATDLAQEIVEVQETEIERMADMLDEGAPHASERDGGH